MSAKPGEDQFLGKVLRRPRADIRRETSPFSDPLAGMTSDRSQTQPAQRATCQQFPPLSQTVPATRSRMLWDNRVPQWILAVALASGSHSAALTPHCCPSSKRLSPEGDCCQHMNPKIQRERCRHTYRPPPTGSLNPRVDRSAIPTRFISPGSPSNSSFCDLLP